MEIKNVIKLTKQFWDGTGQLAIQWIRADAEKGKFQNNTSNHPYKSEQYKKYKANDMRRFTVGEANQKKKDTTYGSGKRLQGYSGITIESRETSFINMILTGRLFKGFKVKKSDDKSVTIGFNASKEDIGKLRGAEQRGTSLLGLSAENKEKVKGLIIPEFEKNKKALPKEIKIQVKI